MQVFYWRGKKYNTMCKITLKLRSLWKSLNIIFILLPSLYYLHHSTFIFPSFSGLGGFCVVGVFLNSLFHCLTWNLSEIMERGVQEVAGILARLRLMFWLLLVIKFGYVYVWLYMFTMSIMLAIVGSRIIFCCTGKRQIIQEKEFCWEAFSHAI